MFKVPFAKQSKTRLNITKRLKCLKIIHKLWASSLFIKHNRSKDTRVQKIARISKWVSLLKENSYQKCKFRVRTPAIIWCQRVMETSKHHSWNHLTTTTNCKRLKKRISIKMLIVLFFFNNQPNKFLIQIRHFKWRDQWKCSV